MSSQCTEGSGKIRAVHVKINAAALDNLPCGFGSEDSLATLRIQQESSDQCEAVFATPQANLQTERRTCSSVLSPKRLEDQPEEKA